MKIYLKNFFDSIFQLFLYSFWRVPKELDSKWNNRFSEYLKIKKYINKKEYMIISKDNCYILLNKHGLHLSVVDINSLTYTRKIGSEVDKTFLLNKNITAKYILSVYTSVQRFLNCREQLYETINKRYEELGQKYINSDEFLSHLHQLSYGNYYDIMELKNNINYTNKEKLKFLGDYYSGTFVSINCFRTFEEIEEIELNSIDEKEYNNLCFWTNDKVATALSLNDIDSIICINPSKIHGITLNKNILTRMKKKYFKY